MNAVSDPKVLLVANQIEELVRVEAFLEELGESWDLPVQLVFSLNLVIEEALANIISYGYDDQGSHQIRMEFAREGSDLRLTIIDDGHEYDPTLKMDPDINLSVGERPVGGLGIFLIKKIMDRVEYQREDNKNYLILTKNIES
jgi:anti-sigma regulatory factor (Ser/Thr protein kinase)